MWWILIGVALVSIYYVWFVYPYKHWIRRGVKQGSPVPLFGDNWDSVIRKSTMAEIIQKSYNLYPKARYVGTYNFVTPGLTLRDPDLIKQITVKDFDHFVDHNVFLSEEIDPLWGKNLFALTGQRWRDMRPRISPTFTSSKMRYMFKLIDQSGEQFVKYFLKENEDLIAVEVKDSFSRYTNDVIANAVFGVKCDSLTDRDNEFYLMGQDITNFKGFWTLMQFILHFIFPTLSKYSGIRIFSEKPSNFFSNLVKNNIVSREKHGIVRPDMINLLMEARKHDLKHEDDQNIKDTGFATAEESEIGKNVKVQKTPITDEDIIAQALIFFFAGFETVSTLMVFAAYELAINPEIQQKLLEEVDETINSCNGKLTYETLLGMKYLDMVVSETLRKWPVTVAVDRVCTKPYTIEPKFSEEVAVHLKEKEVVGIPIYAIHRDPQYYPNPDHFDPERFSDENKANITPYTYLPFGSGPRNCIGSRFALLETKVLFFHVLSHFEIVPVEKSEIPIKISKQSFTLLPENGLWLGFKRRM